LFEWYAQCIALRRRSDALATGSLRWVHVGADVVVYLRETADDRLLCAAARNVHAPVQIAAEALDCERLTTLVGGNAAVVEGRVVLPAEGPAFHVWRLTGRASRASDASLLSQSGSPSQKKSSTEVDRG
jgi:alpha-glucosidase